MNYTQSHSVTRMTYPSHVISYQIDTKWYQFNQTIISRQKVTYFDKKTIEAWYCLPHVVFAWMGVVSSCLVKAKVYIFWNHSIVVIIYNWKYVQQLLPMNISFKGNGHYW